MLVEVSVGPRRRLRLLVDGLDVFGGGVACEVEPIESRLCPGLAGPGARSKAAAVSRGHCRVVHEERVVCDKRERDEREETERQQTTGSTVEVLSICLAVCTLSSLPSSACMTSSR